MMRNVFAALVAVFMVSAVHAGEEELYFGAAIGQLDLDSAAGSNSSGYVELTAGVQVTEAASVEMSYQHLDGFDNGGNGNVINVAVVGEKFIGEKFALLGRTFVRFMDLRGNASSADDATLGFGVGFSYDAGEEGGKKIRVEYRMAEPGSDLDETYIQFGLVHYFD